MRSVHQGRPSWAQSRGSGVVQMPPPPQSGVLPGPLELCVPAASWSFEDGGRRLPDTRHGPVDVLLRLLHGDHHPDAADAQGAESDGARLLHQSHASTGRLTETYFTFEYFTGELPPLLIYYYGSYYLLLMFIICFG